MPPITRFPLRLFFLMTALPALIVGAALWFASSLLPPCETTIAQRLTAPDGRFDLVMFSRQCGTDPNTQLALIPAGDPLPDDAASFAAVGAETDLAPRWDAFGNIEVTLPVETEVVRRDDDVAGITVIYR